MPDARGLLRSFPRLLVYIAAIVLAGGLFWTGRLSVRNPNRFERTDSYFMAFDRETGQYCATMRTEHNKRLALCADLVEGKAVTNADTPDFIPDVKGRGE